MVGVSALAPENPVPGEPQLLLQIATLLVIIWIVLATAHITRAALDWPLAACVPLAILLFLAEQLLLQALFFGAGGDGVYGLTLDGQKLWQYKGVHVDMSPAAAEHGVFFGSRYVEPAFYCLKPDSGALRWKTPAPLRWSRSLAWPRRWRARPAPPTCARHA